MIENTLPVGYLETFHIGQFPASMGNVTPTTVEANTPDKQWPLVTMLHQFLTDRNRDIWDLNGD